MKKDFKKIPPDVKKKITAKMWMLAKDGKLIPPYGKKITNYLFEIRVRKNGQWRVLYSYVHGDAVILSAFLKKTQKTPTREIEKALKRLQGYI